MRLWKWLFFRKRMEIEEPDTLEIQLANARLESAQSKLEQEKATTLPELARAVASARRVKYKVDSFTKAYDKGMQLRGGNHG